MARIEEIGWTIRFVAACLCGTLCVGAIVWAAIQISDRPAWLTIALAILGLLAPPTTWGVIHYRRIQRLYVDLKSQIDDGRIEGGEGTPGTDASNPTAGGQS